MNISLDFSPEDQAQLEKRAAASGLEIADYIRDMILEELETEENGAVREPHTRDDWEREFRKWVASHRSRNPGFDDSRESIYE